MDESFSSEHVQTPSIWEHKGDTSTTAFPNLFFDDSISSMGGASCADPSIHLSTDCTDDGGYSTITNVIAEGIRSKSTFEVIEIDSSSSCAGCDELVLKRLSDVSPSFPDGTIVNSPHDQYQEQGNYHDPIDRQDAIIHVNDDQDFNADNSIAMSSLTNNESSLSVRWRSATDRMGMLFKPFRDATRPQVTSFDETYGSNREVSGLNSFIVTSPENVLSIFRPQPHPEFHIRQSTPVISSSCSPENLVITTTHSHNTHSICMVGSDIEVRNSEEHSVPQPFTDDKRDRYGAAVMRSYQPKQHPFMLLSSFAENAKCKKLHIMSLLIISALLVGIISVTIIAGGESNVLNEESITNSAEKQPQESGQDNVSLPSACCINHVDHFDAMQKETESNKVKQELYTSIFDHDVVVLPAIINGTYTEDTLMNNPIESVEDIGSISSASSKKKKEKKNEQSPNLPSNDKEGGTETVPTYPVTPEPSSSSPSKIYDVTTPPSTSPPTSSPRSPSTSPATLPSMSPNKSPLTPSTSPSTSQGVSPSKAPSNAPSQSQIKYPSKQPTDPPSTSQGASPSKAPSLPPNQSQIKYPSKQPTDPPSTLRSSLSPIMVPRVEPTPNPSLDPISAKSTPEPISEP